MKTNEKLLEMVVRVGRLVGGREGWDVFDIGGGRFAVQADDEHAARLSDNQAIRLAKAAGIDCDVCGRIRGLNDDAEPSQTQKRSWDVFIDTGVNVEMPAHINPDTDEGLAKIREAATAKLLDAIEDGCFDIRCEEYCGE